MTAVAEPSGLRTTRDAPDFVVAAVDAFKAGDKQAFAVIYRYYYRTVIGYVYKRVRDGGRVELAEDLAAEVFLRAFRRLSSHFEWQGRDLGAWLVTIARNLLADHYKSGRIRLETVSDTPSRLAPGLTGRQVELPAGDNPEVETASYLQGREIAAAMLELVEEQRECLVLRFYRGLSVRETGEAMGKSEGAIKALQYRAVRSLARIYEVRGWEW